MFSVDSRTSLADIQTLQDALQQVNDRRLSIVQATAQFAVNDVRERIQLRGQNTDGETMLSSSPKRIGRYSEGHGRVRQREGLRTDLINLTMSGDLLNGDSWTVLPDGADGFGAGFREDSLSERAGFLEDAFGPIFQMSYAEEQAAADYFNTAVSDLVTATF